MAWNLFLLFEWFFFRSAIERTCTRVTKLNWDAIEMAVGIIDSNNRYVQSRLHDESRSREAKKKISGIFHSLYLSGCLGNVDTKGIHKFVFSDNREFWNFTKKFSGKFFPSHLSKFSNFKLLGDSFRDVGNMVTYRRNTHAYAFGMNHKKDRNSLIHWFCHSVCSRRPSSEFRWD